MTSPSDDFDKALRDLPLFPLHQAVLFPGMLMPLHVFEPRYRKLVRDVLAGHRSLAIPHVVDAEADMRGNPSIATIAGAGTIVEHTELPGGRFHIVVVGRARVKLQELHFKAPYRRALATVLEPAGQPVSGVELAALHAAASAFVSVVRARDPSFELHLPKDADAEGVTDGYAHRLIISPEQRQRALEELDLRARVRHVTEVLSVQRATLSPASELN